jgi:hypothetical protein
MVSRLSLGSAYDLRDSCLHLLREVRSGVETATPEHFASPLYRLLPNIYYLLMCLQL